MSIEGHGVDYVKLDLVDNLPPSIVKEEPYAFDEGYSSDCYRLVRVLLSLPLLGDVEVDLDLEVEFGCCDGSLFDSAYHKIIVYANYATLHYLMLKKDLHFIYLKWFLFLPEFEFEVHDKGGTIVVKSRSHQFFHFQKDDCWRF